MNKCLNCGKSIKDNRKFCCRSCAATYNNLHRKHTTKGEKRLANCIICGKQIEVSIHINKSKCKCDSCKKHNRPHFKELNSILDCSKRTAVKIIKRSGLGCAICGWNESTCDIHHIICKKDGGSNDNDNLIIVCPNCHRIIHTTSKYNREFLKQRSIKETFANWKDFYHISN